MVENISNGIEVEDLLVSEDPAWLWDGARGRVYWANDAALGFWNADSVDELCATEFDHAMPALGRLRKLSHMDLPAEGRNERFVFWTNRGSRRAICNCVKIDVEGFGDLLLVRANGQNAGGQKAETHRNGAGHIAPPGPDSDAASRDAAPGGGAQTSDRLYRRRERGLADINGSVRPGAVRGAANGAGTAHDAFANGQATDQTDTGREGDDGSVLLEIARRVRAESKYENDASDKSEGGVEVEGEGEGEDESERKPGDINVQDISRSASADQPTGAARPSADQPTGAARPSAANDEVEFLAKISHEVRTPLNSILGFSELMMQEHFGSLGNEKYAGYISDIHESAQLALSLINDLLSLSKMNAGQFEPVRQRVDLNEVARITLSIMRPQAEKNGITLKAELSSEQVTVQACLRSLKQIFLNLLSNAIKFTPSGGSVSVVTGFEDGISIARICDTGPGMTPHQIVKAMQPYGQLDTAPRNSEGTGLGLPITNALVEANGGVFLIESEPGEGTEISVRFSRA